MIPQHGILTPRQSGFQLGDSLINQLLSITHKIYCSFENIPSLETRCILDLSKALKGFVMKEYPMNLNVSGQLLTLLRNFLTKRLHRVVLNGKNSRWLTVTLGVPQGSVLDPLHFLVYINDLVEGMHSDVKLFADDTPIFPVVRDKDEATENLNQDLERGRLWAWQLKIHFKSDKTEDLIFSVKKLQNRAPAFNFGVG